MLSVKFFNLSKEQSPVTGGHFYDRNLSEILSDSKNIEFEHTNIASNKKISKFLLPAVEFFNGWKKKKNADVIIFNSSKCLHFLPLAVFLRLFSKSKVHVIHHHFIYLEFHGLKKWIYKNAESRFLKVADKIIVPSPYIYEELKKYKKEKDLLLFRIPFEARQEFPAAPQIGNLTFTGTIEPRKGLIYLFRSLKELGDRGVKYNLNIVGKIINENYYQQLKDYAETHNLKVNFLGFLDKTEKNKILSETDIFVFPSLLEGFGMVLVEAQVYGLPIVSFDNSAMPTTVKNDINGFTVPSSDFKSFADKIEQIIKDRSLRAKLSEGALDNLKNQWTQEKFSTAVKEYYSNLIQEKD